MNINEIARLSGVSIGTVDRVIHRRGRVAKDTEARIESVIRETGYAPNALARQLKLKKPHKIGCLMPSVETEGGYWQEIVNGMKTTIDEELRGFAFSIEQYKFSRRNRKSLYEAWKEMKDSDACAYVIAPVMQEEIMCILKNDENVKPYCFIDTLVPSLNPVCTICQDPYQAGIMAGKLTYLTAKKAGKTGKEGEFIVSCSDTEAYNLNERVRGFRQWMENNGCKVSCVFCDGEKELPYALQRTLKEKGYSPLGNEVKNEEGSLMGVCVVNALTHIASDVLREAGLFGKVAVVGFDLIEKNRQSLLSGGIDALISQRPSEQGRIAIMELYHFLILGDKPKEKVDIPIDVYFKENIGNNN